MRITYSKLLAPTNTNITVAAYRYSSSGFLSLQDAAALRDLAGRGMTDPMLSSGVQRGRLQLTVNQTLPHGYGSFYLSQGGHSSMKGDSGEFSEVGRWCQ